MAHLLRKTQSGISNDLSSAVTLDKFTLTSLTRIGISSRITQLAYDPVQSLLAVGTASTKFGPGQIYVFGKGRIEATFPLTRKGAGVKKLLFCGQRLVCLDDKGDIVVVGLTERKLIGSWSPPGQVTAIACDATLDYVLLGMNHGELLAYDMDRENLAELKLPNFWQQQNPRSRALPVISLEFHPRDIGTLLIAYPEGAVIYSFKQNKALKFFHYQVPRGAPGGDADPTSVNVARNPLTIHAVWHPTGIFVLTGHDDSSLVVWDAKDGRLIMARTVTDTNVDKPGSGGSSFSTSTSTPKTPLHKIAWCANQDPDDTGILVAGGVSAMLPGTGLTFMELGRTPTYATSPWQLLSDYIGNPKKIKVMPTPPNVEVVNFCLIPRKSPWFAGANDPIAALALLSSGEVTTLSFPSGYPISPTNQLHLSLNFVHPFVSYIAHSPVDRTRWLGMVESRNSGPPLLKGGVEATTPLKRGEDRNVVQTAHADGTIRLWDAGHGDEIENPNALQADVARAVGRLDDILITRLSLSASSGELAAGLKSGEIVVFKWNRFNNSGREPIPAGANKPKVLTNVTDRRDPSLIEGFHPFTLLNQEDGPCCALKVSDVGFVAAGFEGGSIVVIDMRGPAIIFDGNIQDFGGRDKLSSFRRKSEATQGGRPVKLDFSVMMLEGDNYSSILLHVGTDAGLVATLKILPDPSGRYNVAFAGSTSLDDAIIAIHPLNITSGKPAYATPAIVASLREGVKVDGVLIAVSKSEARIFRPATSKGAHKSWDNMFCHTANVTKCRDIGWALVGLFGNGTARAFSIPGLKEIGSVKVDDILDVKRFSEAVITSSGDILGWSGPSEMIMVNVWGRGENEVQQLSKLINPTLIIPPRPTISNFEWVSGTQYMTPSDLDLLIGGPTRPPSKRMLAQSRADEAARSRAAATNSSASASTSARRNNAEEETYWGYMSRQVNERAEALGLVGDGMDKLEENSGSWAEEAGKFVQRQKKGLVLGAMKRSLGM